MLNDSVIDIAKQLINRRSVTPEDAGCQDAMREFLGALGFNNETMVFEDTTNLWSRRGKEGPVFCFAGHTDVVPSGPEDSWKTPPFTATEIDGYLHGRGAADMKGSLAAMLVATREFVNKHPDHQGSIAYLITSDEEGNAEYGTKELVKWVVKNNEVIDDCLVGEPTSSKLVGDTIKIGRRGSLSGFIVCKGKQGHIAYPKKAINPVEELVHFLGKLKALNLDNGSKFFESSSLNISTIDTNNKALNVIPENCHASFNVRFNDQHSCSSLTKKIETLVSEHNKGSNAVLKIKYKCSGESFLTEPGQLSDLLITSIKETAGIDCKLSTGGGTSDARFIKDYCPVVEFGLVGDTMHQVNENTKAADIVLLKEIYRTFLKKYNKKV